MCGVSLLRCTLYKRQTDVCYARGGLGHRADVCPNPNKIVCRGCGLASPLDDHQCSPKCALCGGPHPTADRTCKQRFQVPSDVQRRRRRRKRTKKIQQQLAQEGRPRDSSVASAPSRGCSVTPAGRWRSLSRGRSHFWCGSKKSLPGRIGPSRSQAEASGVATKGNAGSIARA